MYEVLSLMSNINNSDDLSKTESSDSWKIISGRKRTLRKYPIEFNSLDIKIYKQLKECPNTSQNIAYILNISKNFIGNRLYDGPLSKFVKKSESKPGIWNLVE